ncbi:MAG: bifunctional alpha,alpha-trehalose-phosphate synthase (UDP-forming)/trehalose-phosphatase [Actinobacteria bacterium]|nr:bifunctional alpha,alpha-trehalose-phosphate synthase (UDP-forming)/trehalose-phosphatase [Actinomycetota bacterium]MBU2688991.1 bifunctional alpha,alpha-trehalose-phosphate synthase (UDP-forming)/trehalose-phosphatase [Actinomycetota bacterium]
MAGRIVVVSNRGPVTVSRHGGGLGFHSSTGGLASGLEDYLEGRADGTPGYIWIGWPGIAPRSSAEKEVVERRLRGEYSSRPVFLAESEFKDYYEGFCNSNIWPLFHYFPSYASFESTQWRAYRDVNDRFAEAALSDLEPGDTLWVHDYQLMLVPGIVRKAMPEIPIGFFLHIPFPSYEIFRLLPSRCREDLLQGMLGSDLVGFHTHDYTQYFLRCVLNVLGLENDLGRLNLVDRVAEADTFPMGIDFGRFSDASGTGHVKGILSGLRQKTHGKKVIVSVDRLDYTKGIKNRLLAFDSFLRNNPRWRTEVVLVMVVVPSRGDASHYRQMRREINELVGRISGEFGSIDHVPIFFQYKRLDFDHLVAFYCLGDVALITPIRDGMNLIAKEFLAARNDGTGVLVLSEMAGAAKELGESLLVNPNDVEGMVAALIEAVEMPVEEQVRRNRIMRKRLQEYGLAEWGDDFLSSVASVHGARPDSAKLLLEGPARENLLAAFGAASRRFMLLDYDGTLVPIEEVPEAAVPPAGLLETLGCLAAVPGTDVVMASGRDMSTLEDWFGDLDIHLIAEHGASIRRRNGEWEPIRHASDEWKSRVAPILDRSARRLPGSFVEEKRYSIAWHYRRSDPEFAAVMAKKLVDDLMQFTANTNLQVMQGRKVVEVRSKGVDKGSAALETMAGEQPDFIFAAGDDRTDEDLFAALPEGAYTVSIGPLKSRAEFGLRHPDDLVSLLREMCAVYAARPET